MTSQPQQPGLTDAEYATLLGDAELYFESCLQIRTKEHGLQPFKLNSVQRIAHQRMEDQLARTGRVRMLVLKGRQMGISTYVGARFYRKTSTSRGTLAYIVRPYQLVRSRRLGMTPSTPLGQRQN